ncbi:uncharacterized protein SPSK_10489 [Sporothrix schenckii 1099-18]|uniref:Secreted protein n=1 Tax=Sporothrix schenckii 1099-18 TaxID=1397361 RepID=A0A0F2MAQ7_SPOSC|nr:uncharacterized protein SPSK_10489 [Sporothrix schenckii 1099-18]KJR86778.1 hypothetical protein SPSK_10489 [Sporothrix schenckii 1099-18]
MLLLPLLSVLRSTEHTCMERAFPRCTQTRCTTGKKEKNKTEREKSWDAHKNGDPSLLVEKTRGNEANILDISKWPEMMKKDDKNETD